MAMRTGRVVVGWGALMLGLALGGVLLSTSGSQAGGRLAAAGDDDAEWAHAQAQASADPDAPVEADTRASADAKAEGTGDVSVDGNGNGAESADRVDRGDRVDGAVGNERLGDRFDALVRTLQAREGVENTSPPFMWLASLAVRAARPAGVLDLRLATFEGHRLGDLAHDSAFAALVNQAASDGWAPLLRVRSKRSREMVSIHARTRGNHVSLLLVTVEKGEAVVAQVAVNPDTVAQWIKEPGHIEARLRH